MSLILEALRKSEAERRRGQAPDLAAELPPLAPQGGRRIGGWTWLALGSLALLAAAWMWRDATRPAVTAAGDSAREAVAPALPDTTAHRAQESNESPSREATEMRFPPVERIAPAQAPEAAAAAAVAVAVDAGAPPRPQSGSAAQQATPVPEPTPAPTSPPAARPPRTAGAGSSPQRLPTVAELPSEERRQLPALKLSMHMWNEDPERRFVILDGTRYGEGDRVGPAVIAAIDLDGVRLELNGRGVRLPLR